MLSAMGANKGAKRTAFAHLYFNMIGSVVFLILYYVLNLAFQFDFAKEPVGAAGIAAIHSVFNIFATLLLLPFIKGMEKLAYLTIPVDKEEEAAAGRENQFQVLDERFLATPSFAIEQCMSLARKMAELAKDCMLTAMTLFETYSSEKAYQVEWQEDLLDKYEDKLGKYLALLNSQNLTEKEGQEVSTLMQSINDFERIGDHALNLVEVAVKMQKKELEFSKKAKHEVEVFSAAVTDILNRSMEAFVNNDSALASTVEPLEEVIDDLNKEVKKRHIKRLRKGKCSIDLGLALTDIAVNYERVADHCSNVAVYLIQIEDNTVEAHDYVSSLSGEPREHFQQMFEAYQERYQLS